jgi:putative sigma-54 modulation protein
MLPPASGRQQLATGESSFQTALSNGRGLSKGVESVQIKISARHGHLNEATQQFIREKAEKLPHLFERLTMIEVTVDLRNHLHVVEILVSAEHKHDFVAQETNTDLLAAVDLAVDKLAQQLRRYKGKVQDHRRDRSTGDIAGAPNVETSSEE